MDPYLVVEEVRRDKARGALELASRSVDAFIALVQERWPSEFSPRELAHLREAVAACRPSMSPLRNAAEACFRVVEACRAEGATKSEAVDCLEELKRRIEVSRSLAAERAAEELSWTRTFLTHSLSSTIIELFRALKPARTVVVTEARPLLEGLATARGLASMGHRVKLIADSSAYQASRIFGVEVFVFGADSILRGGHVVNKSGTAQISIAVKSVGVTNVVVCESIKVDVHSSPSDVHLEVKEPEELLKESVPGVEAFNLYFDLTDPEFLDLVVMEVGAFKPPFNLPTFGGHSP
ncbi:MAG: hypothetical protein QFX33_00685 [Candidatus Nezhaarchaeota archaeon]|nr:hypothetical protein [Candidatus Nezhaarchaeota archaeon]